MSDKAGKLLHFKSVNGRFPVKEEPQDDAMKIIEMLAHKHGVNLTAYTQYSADNKKKEGEP